MEDMDEVIQAVAKRHGVVLGRDDPILILQTFFEFFQKRLVECCDQEREKFLSTLELEQEKWSSESKFRASRIVNASLNAAHKTTSEVCESAASEFITKIEQVLRDKILEVEKKQLAVYRLAVVNMISAVLMFCTVIILRVF